MKTTLLKSPISSTQTLSWEQTQSPSYYQTLQLVESIAHSPNTPRIAASLSLLLQQSRSSYIGVLISWLETYIAPFVDGDPSSQSNQPEKVIAIATYLRLCYTTNHQSTFSERQLVDYLEYASQVNWMEDSFLVFLCWMLRDDIEVCKETPLWFSNNLELFLSKHRTRELSQCLIMASEYLSDANRNRIIAALQHLQENPSQSLQNLGWMLIAFSTLSSLQLELSPIPALVEKIDTRLSETVTLLLRRSNLLNILVHFWNGPPERLADDVTVPPISHDGIAIDDPLDVAFAAYALAYTEYHTVLRVPAAVRTKLIQEGPLSFSSNTVSITRRENAFLNVVVFVLTLVLGISLIILMAGGSIVISGGGMSTKDLDNFTLFDPDLLPVVLAFSVLLLVEASMIVKNKPVTRILQELPFIDEISSRLRGKTTKGEDL